MQIHRTSGKTLFTLVSWLSIHTACAQWVPEQGATWWWQINNTEQLNTNLNVDVYDIDLFEGIATGKLDELKANGYRVICYFSAGTFEPFRPDADQIPFEAQIDALPDFPEERWLRIGDPFWLSTVIEPVMTARMQLAADSGCDAVEPDNVDGYANDETNGEISAADQLAYNQWLATTAHSLDLSVGLKNDLDQADELSSSFDFAVNEQCFAYNECEVYEANFLAQGKAVFNQEYLVGGDGGISSATFTGPACTYFTANNVASLWKVGLDLNGLFVMFCPSADSDNDGIADNQDNCSAVSNSSQLDVDDDGYGNACDADINNDCVINFLDLQIWSESFLSINPLTDFNGDGATNFLDLTVLTNSFLSSPGPSGVTTICN